MAELVDRALAFSRTMIACLAVAMTAACAQLPEEPADRAAAQAVNDPFEPANRMMFAINDAVDTVVIRPAAVLYRDFVPDPGKHLIFNFTRHVTLPLTIVNDVLMGEWDRADIAAKRFFVNTIAGFGGIVDAATGIGLPHHEEDFDQTLEHYQVSSGPYIVLPLLGPSSARHAVGRVVDFATDPMTYFLAAAASRESSIGIRIMSVVDQRYRLLGPLDDVKRTSLDYYAAVRSLYRQRRAAAYLNKGDPVATAER